MCYNGVADFLPAVIYDLTEVFFTKYITTTIKEFLPELIAALIVFFVGRFLIKLLLKAVVRAMEKRDTDKTVRKFIHSTCRVVMLIFLTVICLSIIGVPMTSIIAALSAAGIAIGLALKDSLSNVAGGFIILFTKPLKYGDYVKINNEEGVVEGITILYTILRTLDKKVVYIPNGIAVKSSIVNMSKDSCRYMIQCYQISYDDDYHKAIQIIKGVLMNLDYVMKEPDAPRVAGNAHNTNSFEIIVKYWVPVDKYLFAKSDLLEQITDAFRVNGISIPVNQVDLHVPREIKISSK